jgi:sporulation protein YlmC with PRC-barrel domain
MFRSLKELLGYDIQAADGDIGKVHDFYFDEAGWITRYLVIDTGPWFLGEKVLIPPSALSKPNWVTKDFPVNLTRQKIEDSPSIETALPISKQQQFLMHEYFRWPAYWSATSSFNSPSLPVVPRYDQREMPKNDVRKEVIEKMIKQNNTLRSAREVIGYAVKGREQKLGQVDDIILDDETWKLVYLVLDTSTVLSKGKQTLIALPWINWISYKGREVRLELDQQIIEDSPPYDPETPITHSVEEVLYDYHGRPYLKKEKATAQN